MYRCTDCKEKITHPKAINEYHNTYCELPKTSLVCPECESEKIEEIKIKYCRCCGRRLSEGRTDYCSISCRKQGDKIFDEQKKRMLHIKSSPIYATVRELEKYNRENKTNISYGQFVAYVWPKIKDGEKKVGNKRRKNIVS